MNKFEQEDKTFDRQLLKLGTSKHRRLSTLYRGLGSLIGTLIVAAIILALFQIF